jgi:hypothetical protein
MLIIKKRNLISRLLDNHGLDSSGILYNSDEDLIVDFREFISESVREEGRENNIGNKRYLDFCVKKNKNVYGIIGGEDSRQKVEMEVKANVWEQVKTAYIKAGYEVTEKSKGFSSYYE